METWVKSNTVILAAFEDYGKSDAKLMPAALRWVKEAVLSIGIFPEIYFKHAVIDIDDCGEIPKPEDMYSPRDIFLCKRGGKPVKAIYSGPQPNIYSSSCCSFYDSSCASAIVLGEDDNCFFSESMDISIYDVAIVVYNGIKVDRRGIPMVHSKARLAVSQYIRWKLVSMDRSLNRKAVPQQEVQDAYNLWERLAGIATGKLDSI